MSYRHCHPKICRIGGIYCRVRIVRITTIPNKKVTYCKQIAICLDTITMWLPVLWL